MGELKLLVIADDLTGANDAGAQFALGGVRSVVLTDWRVVDFPADFSVVVVNTDSRHVSPAEAARRVRTVVQIGINAGFGCFYKKTDSTLRGNIGAELQALCETVPSPNIPFIPALPDLGRLTQEGIHYVHGIPIAESGFARDPLNPIRESRVEEVLRPQVSLPMNSFAVDDLPSKLPRGIAIMDCESNDDLRKIAEYLAGQGQLKVLSGSVALARLLPKYLEMDMSPPSPAGFGLPILFVNGSLHERALEQMICGGSHFTRLRLRPEHLVNENSECISPVRGGNLLVYSVEHRDELTPFLELAEASGWSEKELYLRMAEMTGRTVRSLLATGVFRTVMVFGGDTLAGLARANGWSAFGPVTELEPGVTVSIPSGTSLTLISKAGGFGDTDLVNRIVDSIKNRFSVASVTSSP